MEILYLIIGLVIGCLAAYFMMKSSMVSQKTYEQTSQENIKMKSDWEHTLSKNLELNEVLQKEKDQCKKYSNDLEECKLRNGNLSSEINFKNKEIENKKFED